MTEVGPLSSRRYVVRQLRSRTTRSVLTAGGIAVAVAFFVLFGAMSAGLASFIDDELARPQPVSLYLEPASPTPFSPEEVALVDAVVQHEATSGGTMAWTLPRSELPLSSRDAGAPLRLWGVHAASGDGSTDMVPSPPYDVSSTLEWGRHLGEADHATFTGPLPCVAGSAARQALLPSVAENGRAVVGPDTTVDPWWLPEATDYPLRGKVEVEAPPRGPLEVRLVGALAPGQGDELDHGLFVPLHPLLRALGQRDAASGWYWYPQVVVVIEDGALIDLPALEAALVRQVPGVEGTDDAWDADAFREAYGSASSALDGWLMVVTAVMGVLLVAGVSDTTLVSVTARRRELATLRAVGIARGQVSRLVLTEVLLLALAGLFAGLAGGVGLTLLFGHLHETTGGGGVFFAPVSLAPWVMGAAAALALGTAAMAAAYPAARASREPPKEALRYE